MTRGEIHVWLVHLDKLRERSLPKPTPGEMARAARFHTGVLRRRYLRAHRALRAILRTVVVADPIFALAEHGKPYLASEPEVKFNLARSRGMAAVAVALDVEVGVDIERLRPLTDYMDIARRFLPPSVASEFAATFGTDPEREFFRRWTRTEAMLKAAGMGLYGAGRELEGEWTVEEMDAGAHFAAAVAAPRAGMRVMVENFGEEL